MQRILGWVFFILFTWQLVGFLLFFEYNHYHIKKEIKGLLKRGVPDNELVDFHFTTDQINQLTWIKSNEFEWKGHLFDVVEKKVDANGKVQLKCISDTQEKVLFKDLNKSIADNLNGHGKSTPFGKVIKLMGIPFLCRSQFTYIIQSVELQQSLYFVDNFNVIKMVIEPLTPPPNFG